MLDAICYLSPVRHTDGSLKNGS